MYDSSKPQYTWGNGWTKLQITEKQAEYIMTLATKANVTIKNLDQLKRGSASKLIEELKRAVDGDQHSRTKYLPRDWGKFVEVNA